MRVWGRRRFELRERLADSCRSGWLGSWRRIPARWVRLPMARLTMETRLEISARDNQDFASVVH